VSLEIGEAVSELGAGAVVAALEEAVAREPNEAPLHVALAAALDADGRHAAALASVDRAVSLGDGSAGTLLCRADILANLGRHADALGAPSRSTRKTPTRMPAAQPRWQGLAATPTRLPHATRPSRWIPATRGRT